METTKASADQDSDLNNRFRFISIQNPDELRDRANTRQARSHALKQALETKRKLRKELTDNFRHTFSSGQSHGSGHENQTPGSQASGSRDSTILTDSIPTAAFDTFGNLAPADFAKLRDVLSNYTARQASEPVFSFADQVVFQDFRSVFRSGLDDPALFNAVMLTCAFAVAQGSIDRECLQYQNKAIRFIHKKMGDPETATAASTMGAILLIAGVEARLGMRSQVEIHMKAIRQLLELSRTRHIYLPDGIKRAIFWQDLNASIMTGSDRIVDHTTFTELQWKRDLFSPNFFILPPGFHNLTHLLTDEFIEVLKDVHALQCIRDSAGFVCEDTVAMLQVDNHQAWIESRIVGLAKLSTVLECCYLAAYLSACMICLKVWRLSVIPSYVSNNLLQLLQKSNADTTWDEYPELLCWLLYLGGAFSPQGPTRSGYVALIQSNYDPRFEDLYRTWPELLQILKQYLWSEKSFERQVKAFWEEICAQ